MIKWQYIFILFTFCCQSKRQSDYQTRSIVDAVHIFSVEDQQYVLCKNGTIYLINFEDIQNDDMCPHSIKQSIHTNYSRIEVGEDGNLLVQCGITGQTYPATPKEIIENIPCSSIEHHNPCRIIEAEYYDANKKMLNIFIDFDSVRDKYYEDFKNGIEQGMYNTYECKLVESHYNQSRVLAQKTKDIIFKFLKCNQERENFSDKKKAKENSRFVNKLNKIVQLQSKYCEARNVLCRQDKKPCLPQDL